MLVNGMQSSYWMVSHLAITLLSASLTPSSEADIYLQQRSLAAPDGNERVTGKLSSKMIGILLTRFSLSAPARILPRLVESNNNQATI
jgi:hypothetical protein